MVIDSLDILPDLIVDRRSANYKSHHCWMIMTESYGVTCGLLREFARLLPSSITALIGKLGWLGVLGQWGGAGWWWVWWIGTSSGWGGVVLRGWAKVV